MSSPSLQLLALSAWENTPGTDTVWNFAMAEGYIEQADVKLRYFIGGVETVYPLNPANFTGPYQLTVIPALPAADRVEVYRDTEKAAMLVDWLAPSPQKRITYESLDMTARQPMLISMEAMDQAYRSYEFAGVANTTAELAVQIANDADTTSQQAFDLATQAKAIAELALEYQGGGGGGGPGTPAEILAALLTVDGAGSGLDADLLDGKHASEFALLGDIPTPPDLSPYLLSSVAASTYATQASLGTLSTTVAGKLDSSTAAATYATQTALSTGLAAKLDTATAASTYATQTALSTGLATKLDSGTSRTANTVYAAPNGSAGAASFRALVAADVPTLNQSTTGNAATATKLATARNINGVGFDGTADITVADGTKVAKAGDTMTGTLTGTNISLGGTLPAWGLGNVLSIGPSTSGGTFAVQGDSSAGRLVQGAYYNGTNWIRTGNNGSAAYVQTASAHIWSSASAGTIGSTATLVELMRLSSSGNLGVGTQAPDNLYGHGGTNRMVAVANLTSTVNSQAHFFASSGYTGSGQSAIGTFSWVLGGLGNSAAYRVADISGLTDTNHTTGAPTGVLSFDTKGPSDTTAVARMAINSAGSILVAGGATTDASGGIPRLSVNATSSTGVYVSGHGDGYGFGLMSRINAGSAGNAGWHLRCYDGSATYVGGVYSTGSTCQYLSASDARRKENITDAPELGSVLDGVRIRRFNFIGEPSVPQYGVLAQELVKAVPEAVNVGGADPLTDPWTVDLTKLIPFLVKEVQSLRARVAELEK